MRFRLPPVLALAVATLVLLSFTTRADAAVRLRLSAVTHTTLQWLGGSTLSVPIERGDSPEVVAAKGACAHPTFPLVCVKQGGIGTLSIQENCYVNGQPVDCGTVTWSATTSHRGLTTSFAPNPGNPTQETVSASTKITPGHYYQLITAMCTGVSNCPANYKASIIVLK